ncbi:hypothetical protein GLE_2268 [Lysobacter enzymogenes]|uniref:Uncharacterized protein n=1 Tax=Lysobacter enzymogenes TaxID=69 RepID=A0A0S2DGB5_LYSEN|nr:hypothetical protein GLE_2268 [Lysobacter enzymogenes]
MVAGPSGPVLFFRIGEAGRKASGLKSLPQQQGLGSLHAAGAAAAGRSSAEPAPAAPAPRPPLLRNIPAALRAAVSPARSRQANLGKTNT